MILSTLKFLLMALVILLVGQVEIRGETIGQRVQGAAQQLLSWGGKEVSQTKILAGMPGVTNWLGTPKPEPKKPKEIKVTQAKETQADAQIDLPDPKQTAERITASDRESIIHLLE